MGFESRKATPRPEKSHSPAKRTTAPGPNLLFACIRNKTPRRSVNDGNEERNEGKPHAASRASCEAGQGKGEWLWRTFNEGNNKSRGDAVHEANEMSERVA